ncbi:PDC sensor domain-containing protein, partial [Campylobacter sp. TTU-622]
MQTKDPKNSFKVSSKLTLYVGILIVLVLVATTTITYYQSKSNAFELLQDNQLKVMDDVQITFDNYARSKRKALEILANEISNNPKITIQEIVTLLHVFKEANGFDLVFMGFEDSEKTYLSDGSILDASKGFDTKNSIWFKLAKDNGKISVTRPYKSISGHITLTYATPVFQNGKFIGVVGGDYDLRSFSKNVLALGHSANSYAAVYDIEGNIIFHEDLSRILTKNALSENIAAAIKNDPMLIDPKQKDTLFYANNDQGQTQAVMCNPTSINPLYRVCSVVDKKSYDNVINSILYSQLIVGFLALVIVLIFARILIAKNLSPLTTIQNGLNSFFDFINHKTNNVSTINIKTNDEFGQISNAINENILQTKQGLEQDNQAVKESV